MSSYCRSSHYKRHDRWCWPASARRVKPIGYTTDVTRFRNPGTLRKPANRMVLPANIIRKRSMKSNDQINSDAFSSWVDVQDRREATPCRGQTADPPRRLAGEPNACVHLEATPPGEPSAGINQSRRSDVSRSWYDSALSWLMTAIFEGFAAYAEAMSP
jgi:hypothetical protein